MTAAVDQSNISTAQDDRSAAQRDWNSSLAGRTRALGGGEITAILALAGASDVITFSGGFPDPATFPTNVLAEIAARLIADDPGVALQYSATEGLASVREYVSGRLASREGRSPGPGELMITSGGIDCMELVAKSYVNAGDVVAVEAPTYLGAIMAFRGYEADVHGVPVDDDGMRVDVLAGQLAAGLRPKILYTIPDFQNPTGLTMSAERRRDLVGLARRYGFLILEDVAYPSLVSITNRRRVCGRWHRTWCSRRGRSRKSSARGCVWGGRPGRATSSANWSSPSKTPTSARGHSASECSRNMAGPGTSRSN